MRPGNDQGRVPLAHEIRCHQFGSPLHAFEPVEPRLLLAAALPTGYRSWETVPNVIRDNGTDTFHVEVRTSGPVRKVTFSDPSMAFIAPAPAFDLRDDGQGGDRVAGDNVFTAGPFRFDRNTRLQIPTHYLMNAAGPAGLYPLGVGTFTIHELDGTISDFLVQPEVGLLKSDIPLVQPTQVSPDVVVTPHLVNVRSAGHYTQRFLRGESDQLDELTQHLYATTLADDHDFFMFLSTHHIEHNAWWNSANFVAGRHTSVRADFTGHGRVPHDDTHRYGSAGRLLGANAFDAFSRGTQSGTAVHEILHQWGAYLSPSLGFSDGAHYFESSSVDSILGGTSWTLNPDGSYRVAERTRTRAAPLDLYLMGLIDGSEVPPIQIARQPFSVSEALLGDPVYPSEIARTVTIQDIQALHGVRTPGPASAQRDFRLAFVAESTDRLLTPVELTYYEIPAAHFTKEVAAGTPDPVVFGGWAPVTRFFGHGTTWRSDLTLREPPTETTLSVSGTAYLDRNGNGIRDGTDGPASPGRTIFIDRNGDDKLNLNERQTITAPDGSWTIAHLKPGTYRVCHASMNAFTFTSPVGRCHTVTLGATNVGGVDFGSFPTRFDGTPGDDHFYVRLDPTGKFVEIYLNGLAAAGPDYTFAPSLVPNYLVMGGDGDDLLTVDFANGNPLADGSQQPNTPLLFMGQGDQAAPGGDGDRIEILGAGGTYVVSNSTIGRDSRALGHATVEHLTVRDGFFYFTSRQGIIGAHVDDSAEVEFQGRQVFTTLTIEGDVHYLAGDREALVATRGVTIADTASLDLQDTDLIVQATLETRQAVLDALAAVVRRARNATPRWSGPGITSGRAATNPFTGLAVVANDDGNGTPLILNHPAYPTGPLNNQMILVKFTYNGDANLDGRVNADDYFRIDSGFLGQPQNPTYAKGDFNYDGKINADDYFLIDSAFLGQSGPLAPPAGSEGSTPLIASAASVRATWSAKKQRRDLSRATWIGAPAGRPRTAHRKRMRLNT